MNTKNKTIINKVDKNNYKIIDEVIFILLVLISIIYFVAIYTYDFSQGPFTRPYEALEPVTNSAGIMGVWIGDISFTILGYGAYLIPISICWLGFNFHKNASVNKSKFVFFIKFLLYIVMLGAITAILDQYIKPIIAEVEYSYYSGGWLGHLVHTDLLKEFLGSVATIVYIVIIMICFMIIVGFSWFETLHNFFSKIKNIKLKKTSVVKEKDKKKTFTPKPEKAKVSNTESEVKVNDLIPSINLLSDKNKISNGYTSEEIESMSKQVELKLKDFGFDVKITDVTPGPVVTQFEISLAPGVKVSQIMTLSKDLARALLVESVRIVDVIPGKPVIGLEIPNNQRSLISLKEILSSSSFINSKSLLPIGLGKDINGNAVVVDLVKMPHLLIAGATGMGKSVGLNAIILSILYKSKPEQVRMIMIDPKIVELACYADIPHLLTPVVTDMNEAASSLWWCVSEMERRYNLLAKFGVRNIESFNSKLVAAKKSGKPWLDPFFDANSGEEAASELEIMPLIVVIIDEYADMLGALAQQDRNKAKRVEGLIVRIAQKARAAGIHLIIATQRPSVDVITGLIKSNVPTRISFKVSSKTDSRTVLDQSGAEQLLGMGDMLYTTPGTSYLKRIHGAFVDDGEINDVVNYLKANSEVDYLAGVVNFQQLDSNNNDANNGVDISKKEGELDPLYDEAVKIVTSTRRASISSLQRRMRIGYNRAARIIEDMETSGIVSSVNSSGNRQVLAPEPVED